mmetsp:Transcript_54856/g.66102  ORF Transcript_54856/g.66102 Transcript_54856/m.66102 type:complete len:110 (-) Transcript_54856:332-661(-)
MQTPNQHILNTTPTLQLAVFTVFLGSESRSNGVPAKFFRKKNFMTIAALPILRTVVVAAVAAALFGNGIISQMHVPRPDIAFADAVLPRNDTYQALLEQLHLEQIESGD